MINNYTRLKLYFGRFYVDYQPLVLYLTIFIQTNRTIRGDVERLQGKLDKQTLFLKNKTPTITPFF